MNKLLYLSALVLMSVCLHAQIADVSVYQDCSKNGYTKGIVTKTGTASVNSTAGRTSCDYVQLWENGPYWATFNVGATITDYANLTIGADPTSFDEYQDQASYYNTANVGGLYAWNNPNLNGRKTTWDENVSTGISDVTTTLWGSNWKTPTEEQLDTIQNSSYGKTTWTLCDGSTTQYVAGCTLKGYKISGIDDYASYSIFLPAAGYFDYEDGTVYNDSGNGYYWSSTEDYGDFAYDMEFSSSDRVIGVIGSKYGRSVRAVLAQPAMVATDTLTLYADSCSVPNVITCPTGQQIRITAVEMDSYHFTQWSDGNNSNPRVVTMSGNAAYTAQFATISTNINQLTDSLSDRFSKVVKDGQLYILREGKTYNAQGGEVK